MADTKGHRSSSFSLSTYLIVIVLIAVIPFLLFSIYVVNDLLSAKRDANERFLRRSAEELAMAMDQEVIATVRTLEALGQSQSLKQNDLRTFHQIIGRALKTQPTWATILLHNNNPKWLLSARRPFGTRFPPPAEIDSLQDVLKRGRYQVGKVIKSPLANSISEEFSFAVRVPILDEAGQVRWVLSAVISNESTQKLIHRFSHVPNEWTRALVDPYGILGARSREPQKFIGAQASKSFLQLIHNKSSGFARTVTLDQISVYSAFSRAEISGWTAVVSVPVDILESEVQSALKAILFWAFLITFVTISASIIFSQWLKRALRAGADGAALLARGITPELEPTKVLEVEELRISLIEAANLLRSREKAKSDFLANMSHELRTPLGIILGMNELMSKDSIPPEEKSKTWEIVQRNGQQLSRLIDDILDLSKIEANKLEIEKIDFSLPDLVSSIIEDFKLKASERNVQIKLKLEENSPLFVKSDPVRVRQIIFNLVGNAVKFTHQGAIEIRVYALIEGTVRLSVKDSGIGLSKDQQAVPFENFTQGDSSHTRKYGGTGLGLSLSRRIARLLEGDVKLIHSEPNHGSEFEVVFKVDPAAMAEPIGMTESKERVELPIQGKKKILIAEDSLDNVTLVKAFLKNVNVELDFAQNGQEAIKLAMAHPYDLIFMDLQMPDVDGYEATNKIRGLGIKTPIVAFTAHALSDHRHRAMASGFTDFVTKPVQRQRLIQIIEQYLS